MGTNNFCNCRNHNGDNKILESSNTTNPFLGTWIHWPDYSWSYVPPIDFRGNSNRQWTAIVRFCWRSNSDVRGRVDERLHTRFLPSSPASLSKRLLVDIEYYSLGGSMVPPYSICHRLGLMFGSGDSTIFDLIKNVCLARSNALKTLQFFFFNESIFDVLHL